MFLECSMIDQVVDEPTALQYKQQPSTGDHLVRFTMKSTAICVNSVRIARFVYRLLERKRQSQLRLLTASDSGLNYQVSDLCRSFAGVLICFNALRTLK